MEVLNKIREKAFDIVMEDEDKLDIQGWMPSIFINFFSHAIVDIAKKREDILIYEVGTWKGLSANSMANICKSSNIENFKIVCIDTWLGSPEHVETMDRINGIPDIYSKFIQNTKYHKNDDVIYPFPIASVQGAHFLSNKKLLADIIYIDAGHEYEAVLLDIKLYWNLLKSGGYMILDDYPWEGVKKAIDEFFSEKPTIKIALQDSQVLVRKD